MSDIILRIPENQLSHFVGDKMTAPLAFWRFSRRPRRLEAGDYIFFTRPEGVMYAAKIDGVYSGDDDELAGWLGRGDDYGNYNACWEGAGGTIALEPPVSDINYSAQGFRYLRPDEQQRLRKRLQQESVN